MLGIILGRINLDQGYLGQMHWKELVNLESVDYTGRIMDYHGDFRLHVTRTRLASFVVDDRTLFSMFQKQVKLLAEKCLDLKLLPAVRFDITPGSEQTLVGLDAIVRDYCATLREKEQREAEFSTRRPTRTMPNPPHGSGRERDLRIVEI